MIPEVFTKLVQDRVQDEFAVLITKAAQYSRGTDRLWNFKRAAELLRCTPKETCLMFMTKHIIGLFDLCKSSGPIAGDNLNLFKEYVTDIRNYLMLLEGLIIDERGDNDNATKKA